MPPSAQGAPLRGIFLGRKPYTPTLALMDRLFEARRAGAIADTVLLLEHEPVITLGRGATPANLLATPEQLSELGVEVAKIGRGGDITLHAPGQLVVYPIVDLNPDRRDVRKYVRALTEVMRRLVLPYGIAGGTIDEMIGLWADAEQLATWPGQEQARSPVKLGAIGVRISRWVTSHGFALNLSTDLSLYSLIVPCGISEYPVSSVKELTGAVPPLKELAEAAINHLGELFDSPLATFSDASGRSQEDVFDLVT